MQARAPGGSLVHVLQAALEPVLHILALGRPPRLPTPASARKHLEQVTHAAAPSAAAHAVLDRILAILHPTSWHIFGTFKASLKSRKPVPPVACPEQQSPRDITIRETIQFY